MSDKSRERNKNSKSKYVKTLKRNLNQNILLLKQLDKEH